MTLLARRYATALLLASKDQNATDQVERDVQALHAGLTDPGVRALWLSPEVPSAERQRIAERLGQGRHQLVQNLLHVLLRRRREPVLADIYPAFRALVMEERGEVEGTVETPRPLSDDETRKLQEVAQRLSGKKCQLGVSVRPELIGGVRLFVGNVLYDGSVQSALEQLEQRLLQAPV